MISNVVLGSNDLGRSEVFYDALLALFDASQTMKNERSILWKSADASVGIGICTPYDANFASNGNGCMVGLQARSSAHLTQVYKLAIELGGQCEGAPGERQPGINAAYFRDLDGHKFGVFYLEK